MSPGESRDAPGREPGLPYLLLPALISLALLNAQISATRLLAYRFFYHFVFFVISMAQLGLAAAGAHVYASKRDLFSRASLARCLLGMASLALLTLAAYSWLSPRPDFAFAKVDARHALPYLLLLALLLVGLNYCGGLALTLVFTRYKEGIAKLYASDLIGASLGCIASVALMWAGGPIRAFLLSGILALGSAALLQLSRTPERSRSSADPATRGGGERKAADRRRWLGAVTIALSLLTAGAILRPDVFDPMVKFKSASRFMRSEWTHIARVDSPRPGKYVIDGDASTDITEYARSGNAYPEFLLAAEKPDVAIIGVGAGPELAAALEQGASSILAVDINPTIIRWDLVEDRSANRDCFHQSNVVVVRGEGRHTVRSSSRLFDLIIMYSIDTWTASSQGAYSLTENFLYTTEAIEDYYSRLKPGGVMAIRRWLFYPPREILRLFTTVHAALSEVGVEHPEDHLIVVAPVADDRVQDIQVWSYLFFSRSPFSPEQLARLDGLVSSRRWSYLYRPGRPLKTAFSEFVESADREAFFEGYPFIVRPAHDSNPFFFQLTPPWSPRGRLSPQMNAIYAESATLLVVCLLASLSFAVCLLGAPLLVRRRDLAKEAGLFISLIYFSCLGAGFMAVELPAIQVMTLFLGHPTYALSVVLAALLLSAGAGSFVMGRLSVTRIRPVLLLIVVLAVVSAAALLPLVHALIDLPFGTRLLLTLVLVAAIGVPLGMPFVAGIRMLDPRRSVLVAWAWAGNGAASVVGSCLVMIVLVYLGSRTAFLLGAACYLVALGVFMRWNAKSAENSARLR